MPRTVKEWIGKNDDSKPPPRVRQRVFDRDKGKCRLCGNRIDPAKGFDLDHITALINGGKNAEDNLASVHKHCHKIKSAADVKEKAKVAKTRQKHLGIKDPPSMQSRPMATTRKAEERREKASRKIEPPPRRQLYAAKEN